MLYDIIFLESSTSFPVTMLSGVTDVWQCDCDITLTLTLDLNKENKSKKEKDKRT